MRLITKIFPDKKKKKENIESKTTFSNDTQWNRINYACKMSCLICMQCLQKMLSYKPIYRNEEIKIQKIK